MFRNPWEDIEKTQEKLSEKENKFKLTAKIAAQFWVDMIIHYISECLPKKLSLFQGLQSDKKYDFVIDKVSRSCSNQLLEEIEKGKFSPEKLNANTTSRGVIMPRSPCMPSEGWTKVDGVPVEARVAVILRPINPDFPTPRTTTWPLQRVMSWTALRKRSSTQRIWARTVSASSRRTSLTRFKSEESGSCGVPLLLDIGR